MTAQWRAHLPRRVAAFAAAAAFMVVCGSAAHSLLVQNAWSAAAGQADGSGFAAIPRMDRIAWALHDLRGMFVSYAGLTSITLLIALLIAGMIVRFTGRRTLVFGLAGAIALLVMFTVMRRMLGTVGVFGARGTMGLSAQMAAGLLAAVLFAKLTPRSQSGDSGA